MKWYETTDKNDILACYGEYCLDIPWLRHTTNKGKACYSVRKDYDGHWSAKIWYGNMGHSVNNFKSCKTADEAKADCIAHLRQMYAEISAQIDEL